MKDRFKPSLRFGVEAFVPAGDIAIPLCRGSFYQTQLPDIAGNGGLRYLKAFVPQVLQQHLLSADGMLLHKT